VAKAENRISESKPEASELDIALFEDLWLNAFACLPADTKPLSDLLRNPAVPMPLEIRVLLADHLNPGNPVGQLVSTPAKGFERAINELLPIAHDYSVELAKRRQAGQKDSSQLAAAIVGKKLKRSDRTVYRRWLEWRAFVAKWAAINRR
jgi:hypothetical protein